MKKILGLFALLLVTPAAAYDICLVNTPQYGGYLSIGADWNVTEGVCQQYVTTYSGTGYFFGSSLGIGADVGFYGTRACYVEAGGTVPAAVWSECEAAGGYMSGGGTDGVFLPTSELTSLVPGGGLPLREAGGEGGGGGGGGGGGAGNTFGVALAEILQDLTVVGVLAVGLGVLWLGWNYSRRAVIPFSSKA